MTTELTPTRTAATDPPSVFRPDIDGLRALAIVLVVSYHAHVPGFAGGFVGVDVFFAISGYLITGILLRESQGGGIALIGFWARRIRRLVPALALTVTVSVVAAYLILNPLAMERVVSDARASLLYVSNIAYAREANDYFANDLEPSVLLNTWSLGVEEQFYLLWPLAFAAVCLGTRRRPSMRRGALVVLFTIATVVSLVWSIQLTTEQPANAFFLLPGRIWEFSLAGLVATLPATRRLHGSGRTAVASAGVAAIVTSAIALDGSTPYPGPWALVPVVAALAVIVGGGPDGNVAPVSRALSWGPLQRLGRLSYSWYLWHWPIIVLTVEATGVESVGVRAAAALGALCLAALTHVVVEDRARFHPRLTGSNRLTYGAAAVLTVGCLAVVTAVGALAKSDVERGPLAGLAEVREHRRDFVCAHERTSPGGIDYCEDGDVDGDITVLMVGDSHVRHWKPAFAEAALDEDVRLLVRWRPGCPSVTVSTVSLATGGPDEECDEFRADTDHLIDELDIDAVVVANSHLYGPLVVAPDPDGVEAQWERSYRSQVDDLAAQRIRSGLVVDTPQLPFDPVDCLAEEGDGPACTVSRDEAFARKAGLMAAEARVVEARDLPVLDITDRLCDATTCPLVIDRAYVYADNDHLTETFVLRQVPAARAFLRELRSG